MCIWDYEGCPWYLLINSRNLACPKASSPFGAGVDLVSGSDRPSADGSVSATVGRSLLPNFVLSIKGGDGRARDAVEDNIGVASDEDSIAGTEVDLIIFALFSERLAAENDAG